MTPPPLPRAPEGTVNPPAVAPATAAWRALLAMGSCWWAAAFVVGAVAFVAIAVPTAIIPTPVFGRTVPPHWWDLVLLAVSSLLVGMVWASRTPRPTVDTGTAADGAPLDTDELAGRRRSVAGGLLTFLAVGCPTCNKLVLVALGTSGALSWFAPIQPVLGLAALALLVVTLRRRLRSVGPVGCAA